MSATCPVCSTSIVDGVCLCNAPWPCPGCQAAPGEPHATDCIDEEIRLNREDDALRYHDWDAEEDPDA